MKTDQTLTETEIDEQTSEQATDELSMLKSRARLLGVEFSNNIGLETLRERVRAKIEGESKPTVEAAPELVAPENIGKPKQTFREECVAEAMKLVRVRITNLDPKKKELPGEIFTVANEFIGTVRKYVPYGEVTDDGFHLPYCLYENLRDRRFLNIRTVKGKNGQIRVEQSWALEFAMEVLPQLTQVELDKLANAQKAAGNAD